MKNEIMPCGGSGGELPRMI